MSDQQPDPTQPHAPPGDPERGQCDVRIRIWTPPCTVPDVCTIASDGDRLDDVAHALAGAVNGHFGVQSTTLFCKAIEKSLEDLAEDRGLTQSEMELQAMARRVYAEAHDSAPAGAPVPAAASPHSLNGHAKPGQLSAHLLNGHATNGQLNGHSKVILPQ